MIDLDSGYKEVLTYKGVPLRLHWTLPLGLLFFFGLEPLAWLLFMVIIVLHEFGHAFLVRYYGHHLQSIDILGFGGLCRWYPRGMATDDERSVIAWGGVAAQGILLAFAGAAALLFGPATTAIGATVSVFLIKWNAIIIALNLIPISPLDGHEAWKLVTRKISSYR